MSSDKRSVTTDALETLGSIIGDNERRDAIHLAVEPVLAAHRLRAGEHVGFVNGGVGRCDNPIGIVDPFLERDVFPLERFWLVVYPRQISSLRHVWEHPAFPASGETDHIQTSSKAASEQWLRDYIARCDCPSYEIVIGQALNNGGSWDSDYLHFNDHDAHGSIDPLFWDHLEVVTGQKIPSSQRATNFSCSC